MTDSTNYALVIGYGNEARGDDGLGPYIATRIEEKRRPNVRVAIAHQLTPEMAEELSAAALAVFVDASADAASDIAVREIGPHAAGTSMTHAFAPQVLLALARAIYGRAPPAWAVDVAGSSFEPGQRISAAGQRRADAAVQEIDALLTQAGVGKSHLQSI